MTCPRCRLHLRLTKFHNEIRIPARRAFHTTPSRKQLGASTYPQQWQTGTYHFNKASQKTYPIATRHTDTLLSHYLTQVPKRKISDPAAYQLMLRSSIAAQRRKTERVFISKSTAKDFGDRVEVSAFVYDSVEAAALAEERKRKARRARAAEGGEEEGGKKRGQRRRLRPIREGESAADGGGGNAGGLPVVRARGAPGSRFGSAGRGPHRPWSLKGTARRGEAGHAKTAGGVMPRG